MKAATVLALAGLGATQAFVPPTPVARSRGVAQMVTSKALPFLEAPSKLDGTLPGDFGFDPMGISDQLANLNYVRAAELKNGRVAMLAFLGWVVQQFVRLPGPNYSEPDPFKAIGQVPIEAHLQIFAAIAVIELATLDKTYSSSEPWNLGFDPLGFSKNKTPQQMRELEVKEIKNARLAMIAIISLFVQELQLGKPLLP